MKKTKKSTTAQGMAAIRAVESAKPANKRICNDPLARQLISPAYLILESVINAYVEWRSPGLIGFIACRCRYIDDYLEQCLQKTTEQVVILGAGLDSRAYRLAIFGRAVRIFEVDQPATQKAKLARIKKIFGQVPQYVTYVPVDFNVDTLDKLIDYGYQASLKTLFVWEGVVAYLTPQAVDATLAWIKINSAPGSSLIFDYIYLSAFSGKHSREELKLSRLTHRFTGEPLAYGIHKGEVENFLTRRGFIDIVDASASDLARLYCTGPNQDRPVADIYSIVHASVPNS